VSDLTWLAASAEAVGKSETEDPQERAQKMMGQLLALEDPADRAQIAEALQQYADFSKTYETEEDFQKAMGLERDEDE